MFVYHAARQISPENTQEERHWDKEGVPRLKRAPPLMKYQRMHQRRTSQPGQQRSVLNGVPFPITAPTQLHIRPPRTEHYANGKE